MSHPITPPDKWKRRMRGLFRAFDSVFSQQNESAPHAQAAGDDELNSAPFTTGGGDSASPPSDGSSPTDGPPGGPPGPTLGGKYKLIRLIDGGGQGSIFLAFDMVIRRYVAIKVPGETKWWPVKVSIQLESPHIVRTIDLVEERGRYYPVMEFIEGQNLARYIREHGVISWRRAVRIGIQLCDALTALHEHRSPGRRQCIAHLDIKPGNIMRLDHKEGFEDFVKLIDLGSAKRTVERITQHIDPRSRDCSDDASNPQTPSYRAPEQDKFIGEFTDDFPVTEDHRTDIFQVGEVLYELVTGRHPFPVDANRFPAEARTRLYVDGWVRPPSRRSQDPFVPALFDRVILTALEKWPEHRFQSAREFKEALEEILRRTDHSRPFAPRQQRFHWAMLTSMTVAAALAGAKLIHEVRNDPPAAPAVVSDPDKTSNKESLRDAPAPLAPQEDAPRSE